MVERLALDEDHVFVAKCAWAEGPQLLSITYDGARRRELVPANERTLGKIVADGDVIYAICESRLVRIRKIDGRIDELAHAAIAFVDLALDHDHVYGSLLGTYAKSYADGGVMRMPKRGGALEWIVSGKPVAAIAISDGVLVFATAKWLMSRDADGSLRTLAAAHNPHAIAIVGDDVIWTEFDSSGSLTAIARAGGDRRCLANETYTWGLTVIGTWIYWSQSAAKRTSAAIWRTKCDGSTAPQALVRFKAKAPALVGNARILCWIDDCDGAVGALDLSELPA
ncbi:MAG: hypothetical protein JWO36_6642 [Myxococcales bacterium]|nr:hypothetical protein [Myxococcales bacterium]